MSDSAAKTGADRDQAYPVRVIGDGDWDGFFATDSHAFGSTMPSEFLDYERALLEPDRSIAAFDGDVPAGIATVYSFQLSVPGSVVPAAGVSWVGVLPTHRRRGVLRALMTHQINDIHDRGEPVAVLWASEPQIYGRFGYGLATHRFSLTVPRGGDALRTDAPRDPELSLHLVAYDDWELTADVYDAVARMRPGMMARDKRWWVRAVRDVASMRDGRSELRCVVAQDATGVRGYARYATKPEWTPGKPQGVVHVREMLAADPAAHALLYRYLFDLDLMTTTELWNVPVDDPVLHWLENTRVTRPLWMDSLFVRLVDVGAALRARTYTTDVDVVIEVGDDLCPWNAGRWRLIADGAGVRCERTDSSPDLAMSVTELGAAYLGGTPLVDLALAGRVEERTVGMLKTTSAAFSTSPAPWCPAVF